MAKDSSCLPFVSILVSLSVPNLSPYFSIFIAILLSGCFRSKESPCLPFLTSLSIAQCSSFWWLWGQDSSPICFRTRLSTSLSHVAVLSGCFRGTVCSLSSVCLRACPPCSLQLMPLLLSLSLLLFFSLGAYLDTWFSSSPICFRTCLPCSLQVVSLIPFPLPFFSQAPFWPPVFLSTFLPLLSPFYLSINCCLSLRALGRNLLSVTFPYPRSLLHVSLLAFLLVSKWSPYISSLHYRASFQVSSMWDFSTLPFLSLLVPLVFPSAFFTSLLITVVLSGCFWDTGLSLSPVCFPILPHSRILVAFLGGYIV